MRRLSSVILGQEDKDLVGDLEEAFVGKGKADLV